MRARETILISKQTGKEYRFSSTHEADKFLGRKKSYVTTRMAYNHKVSHNQTKEEFDVIIKGFNSFYIYFANSSRSNPETQNDCFNWESIIKNDNDFSFIDII